MDLTDPVPSALPNFAEKTTTPADSALQRSLRRERFVFALAAIALATSYVLFTDQVWEDYFITFRHSQNLAEGHGLVYHAGESVNGLTSPLGTLLPAIFYLVSGKGSYVPALWIFRVLSIMAFAAGGLFVLKAFQDEDGARNRLARVFFALLYLLEIKIVAYSINGMETGFMLLFVGWGVLLAMRGTRAGWLFVGLCWAGLMWTPPDGCVYILALALFAATFVADSRRHYAQLVLKA